MFHEPEMNNPHYNDCYFAYDEGLAEALYVFVQGNNMVERFEQHQKMVIAETGFGTGLNLIALIRALRTAGITDKRVTFYSVECFPLTVSRIEELVARFRDEIEPELSLFLEKWAELYRSLKHGWNRLTFTVDTLFVELNLWYGDVLEYLDEAIETPDAWFLDGHSPDKNPDMWNETVLRKIGERSGPSTTVATFTAAGIVKRGLRAGGFFIKRKKGFGGKRHMIVGVPEDSVEEKREDNSPLEMI